mgnify:CR=1 FL=1
MTPASWTDEPPAPRTVGAAVAVFVDGPQPDIDAEGEEIPIYYVFVGDDDAEPIGKVYTTHSHALAQDLGRRIATDRRLELVDESMPA